MVHMILKSNLKMAQHLQDAFHVYYWKMIGHTTMLVIIVNFPTFLVIQMSCADVPDL